MKSNRLEENYKLGYKWDVLTRSLTWEQRRLLIESLDIIIDDDIRHAPEKKSICLKPGPHNLYERLRLAHKLSFLKVKLKTLPIEIEPKTKRHFAKMPDIIVEGAIALGLVVLWVFILPDLVSQCSQIMLK